MPNTVISVDHLSKRYRLGVIGTGTLSHDLNRWWAKVRGKEDPLAKIGQGKAESRKQKTESSDSPQPSKFPLSAFPISALPSDYMYALKDVSFEVKQGEVLGIIGRNGAGKSTLLKILSRVTAPTSGEIRVKGRIASLLEVGTGFHPELTGRENIYLNGAILGMKKQEISLKFDEIVAFSEVSKYIDTPVKRYSSGMYVRLAFAVAAHLEPEILIVDEVLAVGDAAFQKKCVGKMGDVAKEGRTVLFVSHNMGIIGEIAERCLWLNQGQILYDGKARDTISRYLSFGQGKSDASAELMEHPNRLAGMRPILRKIHCRNANGELSRDFFQSEDIVIEVEYNDPQLARLTGCGFIIYRDDGVRVGTFNTYMASAPPHHLPSAGRVTFVMPARQLAPGSFRLTVSIGSHQGKLEDKVESALDFIVHPCDIYGTGYLISRGDGLVALSAKALVQAIDV